MSLARNVLVGVAGLAGVGAAYYVGTQTKGPVVGDPPPMVAVAEKKPEIVDGLVVPTGLTVIPTDIKPIENPSGVLLGTVPVPPAALNMPPSPPAQADLIVPDLSKK